MNNIQKAFKAKAKLGLRQGFAGGGEIGTGVWSRPDVSNGAVWSNPLSTGMPSAPSGSGGLLPSNTGLLPGVSEPTQSATQPAAPTVPGVSPLAKPAAGEMTKSVTKLNPFEKFAEEQAQAQQTVKDAAQQKKLAATRFPMGGQGEREFWKAQDDKAALAGEAAQKYLTESMGAAAGGDMGEEKYVLPAKTVKKLGLRANVKGPGGPTDDAVPGEHHGLPGVMLSDGEAVGTQSELLDAIVKKTNDGKEPGPTPVRGLRTGFELGGEPLKNLPVVWNPVVGQQAAPAAPVAPVTASATPAPEGFIKANKLNTLRGAASVAGKAFDAYNAGQAAGESTVNPMTVTSPATHDYWNGLRNGKLDTDAMIQGNVDTAKSVLANAGNTATKFIDKVTALPVSLLNSAGATHNGKPLSTTAFNDDFRGFAANRLGATPMNPPEIVQPTTEEERDAANPGSPKTTLAAAAKPAAVQPVAAGPANAVVQDAATKLVKSVQGPTATVGAGDTFRRDQSSGQNRLSWNSTANAAAEPTQISPSPGTGVVSVRDGKGGFRNTLMGQSQYVKPDGSFTTNHSESAQHLDALKQVEKDRNLLASMQTDRLRRDAFDPTITDPNVKANAMAELQQQTTQNNLAADRGLRQQQQNMQDKHYADSLDLQKQHLALQQQAAQAAAAHRQDSEAAADIDKVAADQGYTGKDALDFRNFMLNNNGKPAVLKKGTVVDGKPLEKDTTIPALSQLSKAERQRWMPHMQSMFELNKRVNARGFGGSPSAGMFEPAVKRAMSLDDIKGDPTSLLMPYSWDGGEHGVGVKQYLQSKLSPRIPFVGGIDEDVIVGKDGRKIRATSLRGAAGSWQSGDTAKWIGQAKAK